MYFSIVSFFILILISSINGQCTQSQCAAQHAGSTCCFQVGCCPAPNNVCCSNDPTSCCSTQYPVCCGAGKGCCRREYPVCCSTYCCSSGSYCCGKKCCRRDRSTARFIEINEGISKMNQYQQIMMKIYHP
ncbi:unnamed protein product [Rotaria sordida]|uniref:Uncharacterized protein n=1 Tax=Rotaria sordida TaxID=392033 RepID=A0A814Z6K9_9BILA|nr:unnamed protein product [Rotaria sordida]CAF1239823.1 unnamed protein product [Rotaria sordida]CAF3571863.1 unnamed protein product [Rotaria sordida]CAF3671101.1 unnamed protein product [Rotaria sordida]